MQVEEGRRREREADERRRTAGEVEEERRMERQVEFIKGLEYPRGLRSRLECSVIG